MRAVMLRIASSLALSLLSACTAKASIADGDEADAAASVDAGAGADSDAAPSVESACDEPEPVTTGKVIRPVYLIPSDREVVPAHLRNIERSLADVQLWLRARLPAGTSFRIAQLDVVESGQTEDSYRSAEPGENATYTFWYNGIADAFELTGAGFKDPDSVWLFFLAARPSCGQATGAVDGVALLSARELGQLVGQDPDPACEGDPVPRCQAVGGLLLDIVNALGIPDPSDCTDEDDATACPDDNLTQYGHHDYPKAELSAEQISFLSASDFVNGIGLPDCEIDCSQVIEP